MYVVLLILCLGLGYWLGGGIGVLLGIIIFVLLARD